MAQAVREGTKQYNLDRIPKTLDLQFKAEAMSCDLHWAKENPKIVISHILRKELL